MTEFDSAAHSRRTHDLAALQSELLPDPVDDVDRLRAEWSDSVLCGDYALNRRTNEEADRRKLLAERMTTLWYLLTEAQRARSEALSASVARDLKKTILDEHRRRTGAVRHRRRRRASINLTDPKSAARTILSKADPDYVQKLIDELGGGGAR